MATFTTELALRGLRGYQHVEIGGIGRQHGATAAAYRSAYRFCTEHPYSLGYALIDSDPYHDCLLPISEPVEERIDVRNVTTDLGALGFSLVDLPPVTLTGGGAAHGWGTYLISDLLGIRAPALTWDLAEDIDAAETNWLVVSTAGLAVGDALWIDAETVIVTQINGGPPSIDVVRGSYNSDAQIHWMAPRGEGKLYDRPQYWRGRDVRVYFNLISQVSGSLLPYAQAKRVWRGQIEEWDCSGRDGLVYNFTARSAIGRLDRSIGRRQLVGTVNWGGVEADVDKVQEAMISGQEILLRMNRPDDLDTIQPPDYPVEVDGYSYWHARLGDQIVQIAHRWTGTVLVGGDFVVQAYGLLGTPIKGPDENDDNQLFREVLVTDPGAAGSAVAHRFVDPAGVEFCHPIAVALSLITSTGWVVSGGVQNTDYDVLPATWGAALSSVRINLTSFEDCMGYTQGLMLPRLAIGHEGKPIRLRPFLESLLGPFGWFLYLDEDGRLALGDIAEVYPGESWPQITEDDLCLVTDENGNSVGYDVHLVGALQDTVGQQTWAYDYPFGSSEPGRVLRYNHVQTLGREQDDDTDLDYKIPGLTRDGSAEQVIKAAAYARARWFISPLPRVMCSVLLTQLETTVTSGIRLTCSTIPNPFTGGRGMTDQPAVVLSRRVNLSPDAGGATIGLELMLLPSPNVGLWVPSGQIIGYAPGAPPVFTLSANVYTSADGGPGAAPDSDAEAFTPGAAGVGDLVMLVDFDGQVRDAVNARRVTALGVNTVTLDAAFAVVPAVAWPWDHLVFCHYSVAGGGPAAAWTDTMEYHVAQADDATGLLPGGDDPYVYGGV